MDGYKVIRGSGVSMTSPEGSVLLASMFGGTFGPDDVEVFPIELPVMSVMSPHLHTADLVAWVTGDGWRSVRGRTRGSDRAG